MAHQFIAHADKPRTFADRKGALRALERDMAKFTAHADNPDIFSTGTQITKTPDGRFGVVIFCDLTPSEAKAKVGPELTGFVIQADYDEKPGTSKRTGEEGKPKRATGHRRNRGEVSTTPTAPLHPCREDSKQQKILDLLVRGATMADLRRVCVKRDGEPWSDDSIRSALYYDMKQKGYGVRTTWIGEFPMYRIVLPEGYEVPVAPRKPKS